MNIRKIPCRPYVGPHLVFMKNLKELTILHSNDMHGDFLAEQIDEKLVGGVSLLSGYVNMVRKQEKNVLCK